jgi:hypothetical protein
MSTRVDRAPGTGRGYRQLALPGLDVERRTQPLPPMLASLPPQQVWASLSLRNQNQVRQTIVHILQEVLHEQRQL